MKKYFFPILCTLFFLTIGCNENEISPTENEEFQVEESSQKNNSAITNRKAITKFCLSEKLKIQTSYLKKEITQEEKEHIRRYFTRYFDIYEVIESRECPDKEVWIVNCPQYNSYPKCSTECSDEETDTEMERLTNEMIKECFEELL